MIKFKKNNKIIKEDYKDKKGEFKKIEYEFDKNTDIVPKYNNRVLCIIFSESKGCHFIYRKMNVNNEFDSFRFRKGLYIIYNEGVHVTDNGTRVLFYLEGISTPIKMSNIEREVKTIEYTDLSGTKHKSIVEKIKGLKFDSKVLDIFTNRKFAENFTKQPVENYQVLVLLFTSITMILVAIGYGVTYYFS